jgi:ubiquinone/menaquinone biosynthesis C-methylase UbiE
MFDPLAGSSWSAPSTVATFARSSPNDVLMRFAAAELERAPGGKALDIGCGAARNAVPLVQQGWHVLGTDLSQPMLTAAGVRAAAAGLDDRLQLAIAPMDVLPAEDRSIDLIVAHGIWNLARSATEFRKAVAEAARVSRPDAGLFVFTFSRNTFAPQVTPLAGETFVFTQFSGQPQCFLTHEQLVEELGSAGFSPDPGVPFTEHNRPKAGALHAGRTPVIYEAAFRFTR